MRALRHYRRQRGWSQRTLADLAGTRQASISDIELGNTRPSDDLLNRIASALEVSPAFLLLRPLEDVDREVGA